MTTQFDFQEAAKVPHTGKKEIFGLHLSENEGL